MRGLRNPRSCASSSSENTSLVATGVSPPKSKPDGNTYPTWALTRSETRATRDLVTGP